MVLGVSFADESVVDFDSVMTLFETGCVILKVIGIAKFTAIFRPFCTAGCHMDSLITLTASLSRSGDTDRNTVTLSTAPLV